MNNIVTVSLTLFIILIIVYSQITEKNCNKKENNSSFESGFDNINSNNITFSTNFFMVAIMFLIFDVEVSILIPFVTINNNHENSLINLINLFIILLTIMIFNEWSQGALEWNT